MGADINNVSARGVSILHDSVFQGSHSVLELLLQNGVNYRHVDEDGGTVLHCLARYGDIQTTRILTAARLKGLDTDAEDVWGWTARDWLEDRHRFLEDIGEDFELLLESIRDADEEDGEQESEDEEIHPEKEEEEGGEEKEGDENQDHEHDDDDNDTFVDAFEDLTI
ncbi:MAG: hypothetical protein M1833_006930 [Piccolia ochrophora]|nr:MAG: hypothetical protein M1833_006930 [Piccolia ochrophora]